MLPSGAYNKQLHVHDICQDTRGFIWIGTAEGLFFYDGYELSNSKYEFQVKERTPVFTLCCTPHNELWYGTSEGLYCYDLISQKLIHYSFDPDNPYSLGNKLVSSLYISDSEIVAGTYDGISFLDKKKNRFTNYSPNNPVINSNWIMGIEKEGEGAFWLSARQEYVYHFVNGHFTSYHIKGDPTLFNFHLSNLLYTPDSTLWLATWGNGLMRYDKATDHFVKVLYFNQLPVQYNQINKMIYDGKGGLWLATEAGIIYYRYKENKQVIVSRTEPVFLFRKVITTISIDKEGCLWYGTAAGNVASFLPQHLIHEILISEPVLYDRKGNSFRNIDNSGSLFKSSTGINRFLQGFYFVGEDSFQRLWFLRSGKGIGHVRHLKDLPFMPVLTETKTVRQQPIYQQGKTWIGLDGKIIAADSTGHIFTCDETTMGYDKKILDKPYVFWPEGDSVLYLVTFGGKLVKSWLYQRKSQFLTNYLPDKSNLYNAKNIIKDSGHNLWIASEKGVLKSDTLFRHLRYYTSADGLPGNIAYTLIEDTKKRVWVYTINGFGLYKPAMDCFDAYSIDLLSTYNELQWYDSKNNVFVFNGGYCISPDTLIQHYSAPPSIVITDIKINDNCLPPVSTLVAEYPSLISLKAYCKNLIQNQYNRIAYYMENYDTNWHQTTGYASISYPYLKPGHYRLIIKAARNMNNWSPSPFVMTVKIQPPFYDTLLFKLCVLGVIAAIIFLLYRGRLRQLESRKQQLEKIVAQRTAELEEKNKLAEKQKEMLAAQAGELEELNRTKDKLFSIIAHDLKQPFQHLMGFSELLAAKMKQTGDTENFRYASLIQQSSHHLFLLLENLLAWSKCQMKKPDVVYEWINARELCEEVLSYYTVMAASKEITVVVDVSPSVSIYTDRMMIQTILRNLLSNALKFSPQKETVLMQVRHENDAATLIVKDNGQGMTQEQLASLFSLQKQPARGTAGEKGAGLGMVICNEYASLLGSTITVTSTPSAGTTFSMTFKAKHIPEPSSPEKETISVLSPPPPMEETDEEKNEAGEEKKKEHIVVVDDDQTFSLYLKDYLKKHFEVHSFTSPSAGLSFIKQQIPDVAVIDLNMPGMDGITLCRHLREDRLTSHIPLIILTSHDDDSFRKEGFMAGIDDYLTKPFNEELLLVRIRNLLDIRNALRRKTMKELLSPQGMEGMNAADTDFLQQFTQCVMENITDAQLGIDHLVEKLSMSRAQLYRKIHALTGQGVYEVIKVIRLKEAARLLSEENLSPSEVAYKVGFKNVSHFSRSFTQFFGVSPGKYKK